MIPLPTLIIRDRTRSDPAGGRVRALVVYAPQLRGFVGFTVLRGLRRGLGSSGLWETGGASATVWNAGGGLWTGVLAFGSLALGRP